MVAEDPTGSKDEIPRSAGGESLLALQLGLAVEAERTGLVGFGVGARFFSIENVIRGVVDDQRSARGRLLAEQAGSGGVYGPRQIGLGLGLVDCRVGSGVHDHMRLHLAHGASDGSGIREVALATPAGYDLAQGGQSPPEFEADLSSCAGD